jgi:2Fe-2S ferredoxin
MPKVTFLPAGVVIEVPSGTTLLEAALRANAQLGHACGGKCACSTCHVYVRSGADSLSESKDNEQDVLDKAFDVRPASRLGCQTKVGTADVVVEVSRESVKAYLDEHPDERPEAGTPAGAPAPGGTPPPDPTS